MAKKHVSVLAPSPPTSNQLLNSLPPDDLRRVMALVQDVRVELRQTIYKPGELVDHVYFPGGGFCSVVTVLANGDMVEVATIGREGMVGVSAMTPGYRESALTMVQMDMDVCHRMSVDRFRREMDRGGAFHQAVTWFAQALLGFVMQSTACNAVHTVDRRLARWLLTAHDRVGRDQFPITQEFLAMMLGASRPTVTLVAGALQRAGLITYRRGRLSIVNRKALESASCECYRASTNLLGGHAARRKSSLRA